MNVLRGMFELHWLSEAIDKRPCVDVSNSHCDLVITKALWFGQTERDWLMHLPILPKGFNERKLMRHNWPGVVFKIDQALPIINCIT